MNVYQPTSEDIKTWLESAREWPAADWDYYVMIDERNDSLIFNFANDSTCLEQDFFVHALYYFTGTNFQKKERAKRLHHLLKMVNPQSHPKVMKWKAETLELLSGKLDYDPVYWLDQLFYEDILELDKKQKADFKQLLLDYRSYVDRAIKLINYHATTFDAYKEIRSGYFDKEQRVSFRFHGAGCLVMFDKITVDFDFIRTYQTNYRYDAIDPWFLKDFWRSTSHNYSGIVSFEETIKRLFPELIKDEFVVLDDSGIRYFLKAELEAYPGEREGRKHPEK